jgi:PAS domain S-box-containing protein
MTNTQPLARRQLRRWQHYGVAIALVVAAAALRLTLLGALGGRAAFLTFYPAVTLAALYGGPRPGLLAAFLSGVLALVWMEPGGRLAASDPGDWLSLGVFWAGCALICWVAGILKRAQSRAHQAEAQLQVAAERQRGEERFRRVLENISDAVIVDDAAGNVVFANDQFLALYGRSRDELPNLRLEDYVAPEFRAVLRDRHDRRVRGEQVPTRFEYQGLRKDGGRIWAEVMVTPVLDESGRIVGTQSCIRDVAERKRAEEALVESEQRYRTLFETTPDAIVVHREGSFLYANSAALALTGASSFAELAGHTTLDFFRPQDRALAVERTRAVMMGEKLPAREATLLRLDGREAAVEFHTAPLDLEGTRAVLTVIRDITQRKQAEMRLANDLSALTRMHALSARLLEAGGLQPLLQEIVDTAVAIAGAEHGTLQLIEGNSLRIAAHCGHTQPFLDFFASAENRASACGTAMLNRERVVVPDVEASSLFAGTASLPVLREAGVRAIQSTPLISRAGVLLGVLTTQWGVPHSPDQHDLWRLDLLARQAADLIEYVRLNEQREQLLDSERAARSEAEHASRMKDEFIAVLSHELRNPLNAILGWAYILRRSRRAPQDVEQALDVIEKSGRTLTDMITDLLDMSRITGGKLHLDVQTLDLHAVVTAAIDVVRVAADAKGINLEVMCDAEIGQLRGDPNRLQQIICNLLTNAVKFTERGGRVRVEASKGDSGIVIRVSDTGQGIEPEFLPHIFERFRQEDASMSRKHGGLGLGLSIVRSLVEMHGGTVSAESGGKGQGATFTVTLPVSDVASDPTLGTAASDAVAVAGAEAMLQGIKVLAVDDEPEALEVVKRVLEERLAQVFTARCAREGMELLQRARPDVLISDIGMPEEDGLQFMRRVRALGRQYGGGTPAIALTAYAGLDDRQRAMICGYQAHVPKPIDPAQLIGTVVALVAQTA